MIQLVWDVGFKRAFKKRINQDPVLKQRLWDALELFVLDPFIHELKTRPLIGIANPTSKLHSTTNVTPGERRLCD